MRQQPQFFSWWSFAQGASATVAAFAVDREIWAGAAYCALVGIAACMGRAWEAGE